MPIYEYRCEGCGYVFEQFQSMGADNSGVNCPECGRPKPERIFSTFASRSAGAGGSASAVSSGSSCGRGGFT